MYAENAYLTGAIVANSGYIGGANGWAITDGAMYFGDRTALDTNTTGMYLGSEGFGLGTALVYDRATNALSIAASYIKISINDVNTPIVDYIDEMIGYRLEIIATSDILSSDIQSTTLTARVWHGSENVTDSLPALWFNWERKSADAFADGIWNNDPLYKGTKSIELTVQEVLYSATYDCTLIEV